MSSAQRAAHQSSQNIMSTTIVFACKSNSCRSQIAEAWAREWIRIQRAELEIRRRSRVAGVGGAAGRHHRGGDEQHDCDHRDDRDDNDEKIIRAFLDGLFVASVALDESSAPPHHRILGGTSSPTSSLVVDLDSETAAAAAAARGDNRECVTCDGEVCIFSPSPSSSSSSSSPRVVVRRPPKEKAILAMAHDGVDISDPSTYHAKSYREILPSILVHRRRFVRDDHEDHVIDLSPNDGDAPSAGGGGRDRWSSNLTVLRRTLETASREMGMAFAGIPRDEEFDDGAGDDVNDDDVVLDNLVVLCSCPDSVVKRCLTGLSASTLEWDVDPPSASARGDEGDGAYVRVSRQIRDRVHTFLDGLKGRALTAAARTSTTTAVGRQRRRVTDDPDRRNETVRYPSVGGVRRVRKI